MKKFLQRPVVILSVLTIVIICAVWSKIIFHPNAYLLNTGGDAFKNYYTPTWFVAHDKGTHFTGMNYPYGEHVVFTDNQPVISWAMNFIDNNLFAISGYTVGIINLLLFVGLFFCVFFIYKILVHYAVPPFFAVVVSILIGLMNPQIDRFWGHFALGYSLFVPLVWYLMILLSKYHYAWKRLLLIIVVIIFFGFIHIYYVLIGAMFILFHAFVLVFKKGRNFKHILLQVVAAISPLIIITGFMHFTDSVSDRPESPFGFFLYKASFQSVFLPMDGTIKHQVSKYLHLLPANPEGYAYVGITGLLFLFVIPFIYIKRLAFKKSFLRSRINFPGDLSTWLISSILLLFFSMTYPFSWNLEFLLDIITPLKQFRSPGRFAWGFYYVYTISISVLIYLLYKKIKKRNPIVAYIFLFVPLVLQISDTYGYFVNTANKMQKNNAENPFAQDHPEFADIFSGTNYSANDFEAIVFVPSFFQGSEKLYIDRTDGAFQHAMEISYQTGLPLVNYMMSRTSFSQTLNNVQIVSNPNIFNASETGVFSAKQLLLVSINKKLTPGEQFLTEHATKFGQKGDYTFYALDTKVLKEKGDAIAIYDYANVQDSLQEFTSPSGTYYSEKPLAIFYRNSFENTKTNDAFLGSGTFLSHYEKKPIANIPIETKEPIWIEISFWAKSDISTVAYPYIDVDFIGSDGQIIKIGSIAPTLSTDVVNGWVRATENFEITPDIRALRLSCSADSPVNFDELLVRHTAYNVYYAVVSPKKFIVNNFLIGN